MQEAARSHPSWGVNIAEPVLLTSRDASLVEAVEASALALGVPLVVVQDSDELALAWPRAPLRLVAPEMTARAAWLGYQPGTFLVGRDADELATASAELGYGVVRLPEASARLADLLSAAVTSTDARATTVSVVGASGGLGVSTLSVGLGLAFAKHGMRSSVVELAPHGGGLDLLVGAEAIEGLRWSDLRQAHGQLGEVHEGMVDVAGMRLLALSREEPAPPDPPARRAVIGALRREMDVIVVDAGPVAAADADVVVMVVGADVRSVAAARMASAETGVSPAGLVVRSGPGRKLPPKVVAQSLDAPLLGELREDKALPRLADLGQLPTSGQAKRFRQDVERIAKGIVDG